MPRSKQDKDGIYRRKDSPYWWGSLPNGRGGTARRSTGVSIESDPQGLKAHEVRAAWLGTQEVEKTGAGATFDDLLLLYLKQVTPTKRDTQRDRFSAKELMPVFTGMRLSDIGASEVRDYIKRRLASGAAHGTINKEVGLFSAALNWARDELEWEVSNPWQKRRLKEPDGRDRWLTREEADRLIEAAWARSGRCPWIVDFIVLGLNTGMRPGEILKLEWSRVSFDNAVVSFGAGDQKSGKRGKIPANQEAQAALARRRQYRATHCPGSPWVMCKKDGSRIACVNASFDRCVADAQLANVHQHDLRRTFGSWLVQAGVGIERISALLRHNDVNTTARVYAHLRPDDLAEAAAILDLSGMRRRESAAALHGIAGKADR